MPWREPALALEQHQAVRHAPGLLERLEWARGALRPRNHHAIFGVRAAAIIARIEEIIKIVVSDHPGGFDQTRERALLAVGPDEIDGLTASRERLSVRGELPHLDRFE